MNFQRGRSHEEPEINLIPMIDVLLVILIFLMTTTSYAKFSELQISLPQAAGEEASSKTYKIEVSVDASQQYAVNGVAAPFRNIDSLVRALRQATGSKSDPTIIISADAKATHQSVINVMEAARLAGYGNITFTTSQNK